MNLNLFELRLVQLVPKLQLGNILPAKLCFAPLRQAGTCVACAAICLLVTAAGARPAAGEDFALKRWAVVSTRQLQESGAADLFFAELARVEGIDLVERDQLERAVKELKLAALGTAAGAGQRLKLGRLLKADALAVLSREEQSVRLVLCDCGTGARLRLEYLPDDPDALPDLAKRLAGCVQKTRKHFAGGVRQVYGVPPFMSKNLTHQYDRLQSGYAELLAAGLSSLPGVAVIETEEARHIRRELTLSRNGAVKRVVPRFVEGQFEVTAKTGDKDPPVRLRLKITGAEGPLPVLPDRTLKLSEAPEYLSVEVPGAIAGGAQAGQQRGLGAEQQFAALVARADMFARVGDWQHADGLREAALLLRGDDGRQRKVLVDEYLRTVSAPWPAGIERGPDKEPYASTCRRRWALWHLAVEHLEHLIRNRRIGVREAAALTQQLFHLERSTYPLRFAGQEFRDRAEAARRRFVREVYPLLLDCEPQPNATLFQWKTTFCQVTARRLDGKWHQKEDLDLFYHVMENVVPDDGRALRLFTAYPSHFPPNEYATVGYSKEELFAFLDKLEKSRRPINVLVGRYGKLHYQWQLVKGTRQSPDDLLAQAEKLLRDAKTIGGWTRNHDLYESVKWNRDEMQARVKALQREASGVTVTPLPRAPEPTDFQVTYEKIPMTLVDRSGEKVALGPRRWPVDKAQSWGLRHVRCGDRLDVLWEEGAVLFGREKGVLHEVFVDPKPYFGDVAWDGRHVWIGTRRDGLWLVSPEGKRLTKIGPEQGLPPSDAGIMLHPVDPGKVCAIGSFGPHHRAWCAMVAWSDGAAKVNVFHTATRVLGPSDPKEMAGASLTFRPAWLHELDPAEPGKRVLLVGRRAAGIGAPARPLEIDLGSLAVSVSDWHLKWADQAHSGLYFSRRGKLLEVLNNGIALRVKRGQEFEDGHTRKFLAKPEASGFIRQRFLPWKGRVYLPGWPWFRMDPETFAVQKLRGAKPPAHYYGMRYGISAHCGMIAWHASDKAFWRIVVEDAQAGEADQQQEIPEHLRHWPGLFIRQGDRIAGAPAEDIAVAKAYPKYADKGKVTGGRRLTIMTAKRRYRVGEKIRVIHVFEALQPGHQVFVMGPKPVRRDCVDGKPVGGDDPDMVVYDGRVLPSPAADYNYEVTTYKFDAPSVHTIQWRGGSQTVQGLKGLVSNTLRLEIVP